MKSDSEEKITKDVVAKLAEHIGVEPDDVKTEDFLDEDLHLNQAEISDFYQKLSEDGYHIEETEYNEIETVSDIIEKILLSPNTVL